MFGSTCVEPCKGSAFADRLVQFFEFAFSSLSAVAIQVESTKGFFAEFSMLEEIIGPKPALHLVRDFLDKDLAEFFELRVHTGIAANQRNNAVEVFEALQGETEILWTHVPERVLIFQKPCAVRAGKITFVGHVHADDVHVAGTAHFQNSFIGVHCFLHGRPSTNCDLTLMLFSKKNARKSLFSFNL